MTYQFVTQWRLQAPVAHVWEEIYHAENWPSWWKGVLAVETLIVSNPNGIGDAKRYTWRSVLPYKLTFDMTLVEKIPHRRLVGKASGELEGTGTWAFEEKDGITYVRYDWQVRTTRWWMNLVAPIARPFFEWNHDVVMEWGRKALEKRLAAIQS